MNYQTKQDTVNHEPIDYDSLYLAVKKLTALETLTQYLGPVMWYMNTTQGDK